MEITIENIKNTYDRYYKTVTNRNTFEDNLLTKNNSSITIVTSLQNNKEQNEKFFEENSENIKKYITPFFNKKRLMNDKYADVFLSCIEEYTQKGFTDGLLTKEVANLLIEYYSKNKIDNRNKIILAKYYSAICLSSITPIHYKEELIKEFDDILSYLQYIEIIDEEKVIQVLMDSIYTSINIELSYYQINIDHLFYLFELAKKYYTSEKVIIKLSNKNRLTNLLNDTETLIATLPLHYYLFEKENILDNTQTEEVYRICKGLTNKKYISKFDNTISTLSFKLIQYIKKECEKEEVIPFIEEVITLPLDLKANIGKQQTLYLLALPNIRFFTTSKVLLKKAKEKIDSFVSLIPYKNDDYRSDLMIYEFVIPFFKVFANESSYLESVYNITSKRLFYTAIHSLMVAEITKDIVQSVLDLNPEYFIGYQGYDLGQVKENKAKIIHDASMVGALHDLGKSAFSTIINHQMRRITDYEFEIVKMHPLIGQDIISCYKHKEIYEDVILGHHKTCNGKDGYPENFNNVKSNSKIMIDIVSIADTIDALSDDLGRSYYQTLSLDQIIKELKDNTPKRYNRDIVRAIEFSPILKNRISFMVTNGRIAIAQKVCDYIFNKNI